MRVASGSASLHLSHGRGIGPQEALKNDSQGLSPVVAGNPGFSRLVLEVLGLLVLLLGPELPLLLLGYQAGLELSKSCV